MKSRWIVAGGIGLVGIFTAEAQTFKDPVRLTADGKFIDTEIGHSTPFVGDITGDGKDELLVGQFGGGKLWIYDKDDGANGPILSNARLFKDGKPGGTVPTG